MWTIKNLDDVFYYQEHSLMNVISQIQNDSSFNQGIQIECILAMMAKFGHNNVLWIDAIVGTSQTMVRYKYLSFMLLVVLFIIIQACCYFQLCHFIIHCVFKLIHPYSNHDATKFDNTHFAQLWFLTLEKKHTYGFFCHFADTLTIPLFCYFGSTYVSPISCPQFTLIL